MSAVSEAAALLAIALLNYSDDEGYFRANPALIKAALFPLRELSTNIPRTLDDLSRMGYIQLCKGSDGREYGRVVNFLKHQKIDKPYPSKIKDLCKFDEHSANGIGMLVERSSLEQGTGNREQGMEQGGSAKPPRRSQQPQMANDEAWLKELEADPTYQGINIRHELGKCHRWCETKKKQPPSRQRFINWLNRAERPLQGVGSGQGANPAQSGRRSAF